jgi:hypothetical protein
MNENQLEDSVARGERARILLEEPILRDFFTDMDRKLTDGIKGSAYEDKEGRENLYRMYKALDSFKKLFERYIAEGKIASDMLEKVKVGAYDNL